MLRFPNSNFPSLRAIFKFFDHFFFAYSIVLSWVRRNHPFLFLHNLCKAVVPKPLFASCNIFVNPSLDNMPADCNICLDDLRCPQDFIHSPFETFLQMEFFINSNYDKKVCLVKFVFSACKNILSQTFFNILWIYFYLYLATLWGLLFFNKRWNLMLLEGIW